MDLIEMLLLLFIEKLFSCFEVYNHYDFNFINV